MIRNFEDLEVWQNSRDLCKEVHHLIISPEFAKDFALVNQINRSSGSIMDNIAEGFGRTGNKEFIQFLSISKGSCGEVKSQLYRAMDRSYLDIKKGEELLSFTQSLMNQLGGFIHYLKQSEFKGSKFKEPKVIYQMNSKSRIPNS